MGKRKEWFETFFNGLYGEILANQFDGDESLRQARLVKRLLRLKKGARILDIPCGMGRLTLPLAQMGYEMTGLDLSERFIRRARRDARRAGVDIRYVRRDMRDIDYDGEFDAAINWFTSFGYFSDEEDLAFLIRVHRALKSGGKLIIEMMNRSWLQANFKPYAKEEVGGMVVVHRRRFDSKTSRCIDRWSMSKGGRTEHHTITVKAFDAASMRVVLRQAGFREVRFFDRRSLGRLTRHSRRLIAVAKRPPD